MDRTSENLWNLRANLSNKFLLRKLSQPRFSAQSMQDCIWIALNLGENLRGVDEGIKDFHVAALLLGDYLKAIVFLVTLLVVRPEELTLEYILEKLHKRKSEKEDTDSVLKAWSGKKYPRHKIKMMPRDGVSERKNRTPLAETARCMLFYVNLFTLRILGWSHWYSDLYNKVTGVTHIELWNGCKPDLSHLKILDAPYTLRFLKNKRSKWD